MRPATGARVAVGRVRVRDTAHRFVQSSVQFAVNSLGTAMEVEAARRGRLQFCLAVRSWYRPLPKPVE